MFCGKCGAKIKDGSQFCNVCGAGINNKNYSTDRNRLSENDNKKNKRIGIVVVGLLAVILIGLFVSMFIGRSAESTAEQCIKGIFEADSDKVLDLFYKDAFILMMDDEGYDEEEIEDEIDNLDEQLEDTLEEIVNMLKIDEDEIFDYLSFKYEKIVELDSDEFDELAEKYDDLDIKIKKAGSITIIESFEYEGNHYESEIELILVKIGSSWYIDVFMDGIF